VHRSSRGDRHLSFTSGHVYLRHPQRQPHLPDQ
jgi:hypothetical protein